MDGWMEPSKTESYKKLRQVSKSCVVVVGGWVGRLVKSIGVCVCVYSCACPEIQNRLKAAGVTLQIGGDGALDTLPDLVGMDQALAEGLLEQ